MIEFTIGADPECFLGNHTGVVSGIGKIGGSKQHPLPLPLGDGFAVQEDNVALEFNIPISKNRHGFVRNIGTAMTFLETMMQDQWGLQFVKESAVSFPEEQLNCPQALEFGCDPDFNAWTGMRNPRPKAEDKTLRSCGGHVHIGIDWDEKKKYQLIRACDVYLGLGSIIMDSGERRKQLYGKAGACRIKSYGAEYRTLSNFWIFERNLVEWVYDNTAAALDAVENGLPFEQDGELIQRAINYNDKTLAQELINKYKVNIVHAA